MPEQQFDETAEANVRSEISRAFVHLLKEFYGKGPDKSKTLYSGDVVVVLLSGGFTAVERTLLDSGRGAAVIDQRDAFHGAMADRFSEIVERHTSRRVIAAINGSHQAPDVVAQVFVLEPRSSSDLLYE